MLLAPSLGEPPRAIAERLGETLGERLGDDRRARRDRRARLPQPVHDRRLVPRHARHAASRRATATARATRRRARERRVREREPDRADHGRVGAPRRLRRLARAHPRAAPGNTRRARVLRERRRQPGARASASRSGRAPAARSRRRTATSGDYVTELAERIDGAADADPDELAQRGIELMLEGDRATLERFRVHMDEFFSERALHERGDDRGARSSGSAATSTSTTARSGCARPPHGDDKDRVLRRSNGELDLLRAGHRLPRRTSSARELRPRDRRAGAPTTTAT